MNQKERRKMALRITELTEDLNKIRWELIGMSIKLSPFKLKEKKEEK